MKTTNEQFTTVSCSLIESCITKVRMKGLEPPRLSALDPKSSAATNYATSAFLIEAAKVRFFFVFLPPQLKKIWH